MKRSEAANLARDQVTPPWDELRAARVQKRVLEAMRTPEAAELPRVSYLPRAAWLAMAAVAVAVALLFVFRRGSTDATVTASRIELSDGSVALLEEGARVVPELVVENQVTLRQTEGTATYDVVPGRSRKFTVLVDDVRIDVLGTSFRVERFDDGVRVAVVRGKVQVTRAERSVVLAAGEEVTWREGPPSTEPVPNDTDARPQSPAPEPTSTAHPTATAAGGPEPSVAPTDEPPAQAATPSAAELFRKADDARASGQIGEALRLLEELRAKHPRDARVTLATFTIGRLELQRGNADRAAAAFESCGNALGGEALAEAALARAAAGQGAVARGLAQRYLAAFPSGARAAEMARLAP